MSVSENKQFYLEQFEQIENTLIGQDLLWLKNQRKAALTRFATLGFPSMRDELWKYTKVTPIEKRSFSVPKESESLPSATDFANAILHPDYLRIVFINGFFSPKLSNLNSPNKIYINSLKAALSDHGPLIEKYLTLDSNQAKHGFDALNMAFLNTGAFIYLPKNTVLDSPLHMIFLASGSDENQFYNFRNLIVAENNSQASIVEHYIGLTEKNYFTNTVTDLVAEKNAIVTHTKLQQESLQGFHIGTTQIRQQEHSQVTSQVFSFGGGLVRSDTNVLLNSENAYCDLQGLFLAMQKQHMDFHTRIDHMKPHGTSREFYKGVLTDNARGVFNGKVVVHPNAQKTNAEQQCKNILMSNNAEIDAKPELEIYTDDVKCSHGATVGQLDENAVFYLRSRGIDEKAAKHLLIYAFAAQMLKSINDVTLKNHLEAAINTRLSVLISG